MKTLNYQMDVAFKATEVKTAAARTAKQDKLEQLEITYGGRVPSDVKTESYRQEDKRTRAERDFGALGKEIYEFRTEVLKHYKGKAPKDLKKMVDDLVASYLKEKKEITEYIMSLYKGREPEGMDKQKEKILPFPNSEVIKESKEQRLLREWVNSDEDLKRQG